jgi:hypothetical protein
MDHDLEIDILIAIRDNWFNPLLIGIGFYKLV